MTAPTVFVSWHAVVAIVAVQCEAHMRGTHGQHTTHTSPAVIQTGQYYSLNISRHVVGCLLLIVHDRESKCNMQGICLGLASRWWLGKQTIARLQCRPSWIGTSRNSLENMSTDWEGGAVEGLATPKPKPKSVMRAR